MKHKTKTSRTDELRREYTRSDFPNGFVRGKYAARIAAGSKIVPLEPEVSPASRPGKAKQ
jgi:hypothetical protein